MSDKREMTRVEELADMMAASVDVELKLVKKVGTQDVQIENGTGLVIMDMYVIVKALELIGHKALPMMKSEEALRECLHDMVEMMNFAEPGKEREAAE